MGMKTWHSPSRICAFMRWWAVVVVLLVFNTLVLWSFSPPSVSHAPSELPLVQTRRHLLKDDASPGSTQQRVVFQLRSSSYVTPSLDEMPRTSFYQAEADDLPLCSEKDTDKLFEGPLPIIEGNLTEEFVLETAGRGVRPGGLYVPEGCRRRYAVAIVVPYRDRADQVLPFLYHLHRILKKQHLLYQIFFVEQVDNYLFNRGMLLNIGFTVASRLGEFNCVIFSDVDLLPTSEQLRYDCSHSPKHMSAYMDSLRSSYLNSPESWSYFRKEFFGGVSAISSEHFRRVNGFSNVYYGWGGEDDDLFRRLKAKRLRVFRFIKKEYCIPGKNLTDVDAYTDIAKFHALYHKPHDNSNTNQVRHAMLEKAEHLMSSDGLNSLFKMHKLLSIQVKDLSMWIRVTVARPTYNATEPVTTKPLPAPAPRDLTGGYSPADDPPGSSSVGGQGH